MIVNLMLIIDGKGDITQKLRDSLLSTSRTIKSSNHVSMNANISRLVTSDELQFEKHSKKYENEEEDTGYLPPQNQVIEGGQDSHGPIVEFYKQEYDEMDFLYDSEVGTKFRGTTYYKAKRWNQKEDIYLMALVRRYKNNWQKVSMKLQSKRDPNSEIKTDTD